MTSDSPSRIGELLRSATTRLRDSGSETARLDAELLLGHVLRLDRATLVASPVAVVSSPRAEAFGAFVARRSNGEPIAYIRGLKEFYSLALTVDSRALIPRPETELLVDLALDRLRHLLTERPRPANADPLLAWDVGTGSGAIAIALAVECRRRGYGPEVRIRATDISSDALALATENAVGHGVADAIELAVADLTDVADVGPADLLLANLPYIPTATVSILAIAASFEPSFALDGGPDGLTPIKRLLGQLGTAVAPDGEALLEIGSDQARAVREAAESLMPRWEVTIHDDLAGLPRVAQLRRRES